MAQFQSRRCQQRCPAGLRGALLPPPAAQDTEQGVAPEAAVQTDTAGGGAWPGSTVKLRRSRDPAL